MIKDKIRDIQDFPKKGIVFKDITPLLNDPKTFKQVINDFANELKGLKVDKIVGIESRGFIFGAPLAHYLGVGFVPARKPGKLPSRTLRKSYQLEYGEDALEIHTDSINKGESVVIIDDLLATGGTMKACIDLVKMAGGNIVKILFLIELSFLNGKNNLTCDTNIPYKAIIKY